MMISALKITAASTALCGVCSPMMLSLPSAGYVAMNIAGMMAKYFATSLAMENVVSAPRVISNCLPIATTSMSLVGLLSRSTMLPASLAAMVPVFMASPTSACASAGASLVPSPVIATSRPAACSFLMYSSLSLGVACARKSSTPASAAMAAAVSGLSPVIMMVRMPMRRSCAIRSFMPPLTMSFRWMMPSRRFAVGHRQRRSAVARDAVAHFLEIAGNVAAALGDEPGRWRPWRLCGAAGPRNPRRSSACRPKTG